jgi:hypothetical protein
MSGFTTSTSQPQHEATTPAREQELLQLGIRVQTATELARKNGTRLILRILQMPIQRGSRFNLLRYRRSTEIPFARFPVSKCFQEHFREPWINSSGSSSSNNLDHHPVVPQANARSDQEGKFTTLETRFP